MAKKEEKEDWFLRWKSLTWVLIISFNSQSE